MKFYKVFSALLVALAVNFNVSAQESSKDWQHTSYSESKSYGIESFKAYEELLKDKTGQKIIVAVIDSGSDIEHEDLKGVLWTNKGEIPGNGIDDDNNGYIDDVHGWNFLGGKDYDVNEETLEITRLYAKYTKQFEGKDPKKLKRRERKEYKKYQEIKEAFETRVNGLESSKSSSLGRVNFGLRAYELLSSYLDNKEFKIGDLEALNSNDSIVNDMKSYMTQVLKSNPDASADLFASEMEGFKEKIEEYFGGQLKYNLNTTWNPREGKDYDFDNFDSFLYGNNHYLVGGESNGHGSHCAGIIAADRTNDLGMLGVAANVEIMTIRAVPDGDEHDRDIAAAMRYAVDNGAKVISMSYGKSYSYNKDGVDEAIKYAIKKGALFVHAAGNDSKNIDEQDNFPNVKNSKRNAKAWIEVGASSWKNGENLPATFSNYGKNTVDVFAPGVDIYSTVPFSKYAKYSGTSMACPVVAGVAAVIWSHYPEFSNKEIKQIIEESVTDLGDLEVIIPGGRGKDAPRAKFSELSKTGGVVNLYNALKLAEEKSK
jgi:subtilisin family serine protease